MTSKSRDIMVLLDFESTRYGEITITIISEKKKKKKKIKKST